MLGPPYRALRIVLGFLALLMATGAFTVGLCILAITPLVSHRMPDIQRIYPGHLIWGRSVIRIALAALFYF
jgi:hypothetical protein